VVTIMLKKHRLNDSYIYGSKLFLSLLDRNYNSISNYGHSRQRGMTLLIGLILLAMLMVISVIGFRNTTLSERMTGNSVDRNTSFQAAENAGKEAIGIIEAGSFNVATTGHYNPPIPTGGDSAYWTQGAGTSVAVNLCASSTPFRWVSCAAEVPSKYSNNADKAQYVIELLSSVVSGTSTVSAYRISSRSTGGSGNAEVVLQSIYSRTTTP
jgi:type IV pilus assembly protein PilX